MSNLRKRIVEDVIPILREAKTRANAVAAERRAIGPVATQAQTAAHQINQAIEWLEEALAVADTSEAS